MKTPKLLGVIASLFIILSSLTLDKGLDEGLLKNHETIVFNNIPPKGSLRSWSSMRRGSNDGTNFKIEIDTANSISISEMAGPNGDKQDEITVMGATGKLTKEGNEVIFTFENKRSNFYLVNINDGTLVGSFDSIAKLTLSAAELDGKPAEFFCYEKDNSGVHYQKKINKADNSVGTLESNSKDEQNNTSIHLITVPKNMNKEELWAKNHKPNTLAHFTKFELITGDGKVLHFKSGNYILCEGNSFEIK